MQVHQQRVPPIEGTIEALVPLPDDPVDVTWVGMRRGDSLISANKRKFRFFLSKTKLIKNNIAQSRSNFYANLINRSPSLRSPPIANTKPRMPRKSSARQTVGPLWNATTTFPGMAQSTVSDAFREGCGCVRGRARQAQGHRRSARDGRRVRLCTRTAPLTNRTDSCCAASTRRPNNSGIGTQQQHDPEVLPLVAAAN